jgi:3-phosphoshikimate 1-carboxyvinyltransferase
MAMSFAVAGAKLEHVKIEDHLVVAKTFPGFWDALREIGIAVKEV